MLKRLKIKFVCINMLIATSMLAIILCMVLGFTSQNMMHQNTRILQQLHQFHLHEVPQKADIRTPYFMVQISQQGTLTVSSASFFNHAGEEHLKEIAQIARNGQEAGGVLKEYELQYSREQTPFGERIVFIDISRDRSLMNELLKTCGIIALFALTVFFAISVAFARWAVKPVDTAWKQQKQFVADASHELKTPLTVILTNAELLSGLQQGEDPGAQYVRNIQTIAHQMRGLVEGLLDLARLDNTGVMTERSELDLSRLTETCLLPFEPLFFEHGLTLKGDLGEAMPVRGSESHLRQVVDILLDNALKYSTPGTTVHVSLWRQGNSGVLSVSGRGEAIAEQDLKNIFKRFYRIDKVRTMSSSYGLGLSIARSIVEEHGGKIWAESSNGSNTFFVRLPMAR